jgi:acetyl esterase/lipase
MAAVTGNVSALEGDLGVTGPSSRVAAAVPFYPPTDFLQMDVHMIDCPYFNSLFDLGDCHSDPKSPESLLLGCTITTCPDRVAEANPITYVDQDDPPFLILHGTNDRLVPHHQSELLLSALQAACVDATFVSVPGGEHGVWDQWLDGRVNPEGTLATATTGCQSGIQPVSPNWPNWDTTIAFLRRTILST